MLTTEGHERAKAKGGSREPKAINKHNSWKAGMAAYEGQHHEQPPRQEDTPDKATA